MSSKPILIKAGDPRVKLGMYNTPPIVDIRVVAEFEYQLMLKLIERAAKLISNNIDNTSSNFDLERINWLEDYSEWSADI